MKVLLLCDDYWHPGNIPVEGVKPLESKGFEFDVIFDGNDIKAEMLSEYPVILLCKSGEITPEDKDSWKTAQMQQAFIDYVENGGGILAVHNSTVPGKHTEAMDTMIGSRFVYHPLANPVTVQPVKPHPITKGVEVFCEIDEQYRLEILADDIDILTASYSPAQGDPEKYEEDPYSNTRAWICPAGYVRTQGKGRICVLTSGHLLPVWQNEQFLKTLENALNWCKGD